MRRNTCFCLECISDFRYDFVFFHNKVYQFTFIHYSLNIFLSTIKSDHQDKLIFTFRLWSFIVKLAEELFIFHEVELIPRIQFPATNYACKTVHMVNIVLGSSYYIWRWNMWPTGSTFGTKFSVRKEAKDLENVNTFLLHFLSFYLKKSSLQNTSLSLTKHLSLRVSLQWAHFRHLECQLLSNTFRIKRSRIKSPQPVHFGILAEID